MAADALALLIALLAFYLGFRMHYKNALCFGGLCLAMGRIYILSADSYFFELPVFPLYAIGTLLPATDSVFRASASQPDLRN